MMISGANNLYNKKQIVDDLNVFPVPDGDTGTNMSMTVTAMSNALSELVSQSVQKTADTMSYATLRGARGNSGVILSQFFRGISKQLKGCEECTAKDFAMALQQGSRAAYKAVMNPTEGTILTVSREVAEAAVLKSEESDDFEEVLGSAIKRGYKVLEKTPQMLPALKKAGVVDAGGQGWLFFLDGVYEYLTSGKGVSLNAPVQQEQKQNNAQSSVDTSNIKYMYCTEFIVEKSSKEVNVSSFKKAIEVKGDSMLVIDDDDIVKVHIHTNNPGYVLERAVMIGSMINIKIDNMKHQHQSIINETREEKKEIEAAEEETKQPYAFIAVCAGDGIAEIFKDMGIDEVITGGQTMNPSTDDFINAVNKLNAEKIFIFPNNKNIIMAAQQAQSISDKDIIVIPTKSIPQCISAMLQFSGDKDADTNEKKMNKAVLQVQTGQITYAVRNTQIDDFDIKEGDILGLAENKIVTTGKEHFEVLQKLIENMCDDDSEFLTVYCGEEIGKDKAEDIEEELSEKFPDLEVSVKYGGQPLYYYIFSIE